MAKENRKIARSAYEFGQAIKPLKDGQSANASAVRTAYDAVVKTVKDVKSDMDGQMLPPSSNSAKDFLASYKEYLTAEQDILDSPFARAR